VTRLTCVLGLGLAFFTTTAMAADGPSPPVIPLWPQGAPGEKGDVGPETEQPRKGDNIIRLTNVTQPTLTVFKPSADKDTGAAVVICPGGGYSILAWNLEGTEVAEWLNSIGVTGIVLKYRVPARKGQDRYVAPLQDAQRALGVVRSRAKELGLDPGRIGVLGFSAGGHLAATLSTNSDKRTYEPVDAADSVSCRPDFTLLIYPAYLVGRDNALAPELKVTSQTPRTFIAMTEDDSVRVECGLFYYLALKGAKVPAEMHLYPKGGHGYGLRPSANAVSTWPQRAAEWLRAGGLLERPK
jgi:acetyl esterase/lipase